MCKREMAEKQVQNNLLSLGDMVKLINYVREEEPGVGTRRIAYVYEYSVVYT